MARITQSSQIALFSLWSCNQSEAGKKTRCRSIFFNEKKNILYDSLNKIKPTNISDSSVSSYV